ncbi:flagellar protein FliT [Ectothiorhodospira lacustris]|uniref:flagellar protein FliT n=1 Tax=Ectothiorhodospira lacustris TaxID=2899127 RepID=UPI001EE9376C|nr:flagellar protein FliT [Ectothiorhodospira lacustris]MCG5510194.1 flagellar protein FliT [Ectothiorhodospira lacustris]MCG5522037.1 flagellar protein FliT [Ectothiorhodospira lacustris]
MSVKAGETVLEALDALEHLAMQRLEWARSGQWDEVVASESQRGDLARRIQPGVFQGGDEVLLEGLIRIRDLDQALLPLLKQARDALGKELRQVQKGVAGARAYEKVGDF